MFDSLETRCLLAGVVGDFDQSGCLDVADIDRLAAAVRSDSHDLIFDLDGNERVDFRDQAMWVHEQRRTYFGDANLNGYFDSEDLTIVLLEGKYEDHVEQNATWGSGDWNGDLEFDTADFVTALQDGGYERGPAPGGVPIQLGQSINGQFCAFGWDWSSFVLEAHAGQRFFYDGMADDYDGVGLTVTLPSGAQLTSQSGSDDWGPITFSESGSYQFRLAIGWGGIGGDFEFRALDVSQATPISVGETISGILAPATTTNLYSIQANAGARLFFHRLENVGSWYWNLYAPGDNLVYELSGSGDSDVVLPSEGDYLLAVSSYPFLDTVPFGFEITSPPTNQYTLTVGSEVNGTIDQAAEWDVYTFEGNAGQRIFVDNLSDLYPPVSDVLVDPQGQVIYWDHNVPVTLPTSGQYELRLSSWTPNSAYRFRVLDVQAASEITPGQTISGNLTPGMANELFRIQGTAGQRIAFEPAAGSSGWNWSLSGPQNELMIGVTSPTPFDMTLPYDGEYVLVLSSEGNADLQPFEFQVLTPRTNYNPLTFGSEVQGVIDQVGEWDVYTFQGVAGQRIFYDAMQADYDDVQIYVATPSSASAWWEWSWWGNADSDSYIPITLSETGEYQLRVSGSAISSGYRFQLLDVGSASEVNVGQTVSGTLSPALQVDQFRLQGFGGQHLIFNPLAGSGWSLRLTGPQDEVFADSSYIDVILPYVGEYVLTVVGGGPDASLPYEFSISTPPTNEYPLILGSDVSGTLEVPGERDVFIFDGVAGERLYYDALQGDMENVWVQLVPISGWPIWANNADYDFWQPLVLPETGPYRLEFNGGANLFGYRFQLLDVAAAPTIGLNEPVFGILDPSEESALFRFEAVAGQRLVFDDTLGSASTYLRLLGPQNEWLGQSGDPFDFQVPYDGEYLLIVSDSSSSDSSNYGFKIHTANTNFYPMTLGSEVSGAIDEVGEWDAYTFEGIAGQRLYFDALETTNGAGAVTLELPGVWTKWIGGTSSDSPPVTLPYSGVYHLRFEGPLQSDYHFRLLGIENAPEIALDQTISGSISPSAATHLFRLPGVSGQRIVAEATGETGNWSWQLFGPQDERIAGSSSSFDAELPYDGEYILAVQADGMSNPLDYEFRIRSAVTNFFPLVLGDDISGSIDEQGEWDVYEFDGVAGHQVYYDALQSNYSDNLLVTLTPPSGWPIWSANASQDSWHPIMLPESGTYRLRFSGPNISSSYRFQLLDVATIEELVIGQATAGMLSPTQENPIYRVQLSAGQHLAFDQVAGTPPLYFMLIDTTSNWTVGSGSGYFEFRSSYDREYLLLLQGDGFTDPLSYEIEVGLVQTSSFPMSVGQEINGVLDQVGKQHIYEFGGIAGQRIFFDNLQSDYVENVSVTLLSPAGWELITQNVSYDSWPLTLPETGQYELRISGSVSSSAYSLRIVDVLEAVEIASDQTIAGNLSPAAETGLYRLTATGGQRFIIDRTGGNGAFTWILYGPQSEWISSSNGFFDFTIPYDGEYLLALSGDRTMDSFEYEFQIVTPQLVYGELTVNNEVSGTIETVGQSHIYSFEGFSGQRIFFDALDSVDDDVQVALYTPSGWLHYTSRADVDSWPVLLPETGQYEFRISGAVTNGYDFRILDVSTAPEIVFEQTVSGNLTPLQGAALYRLQGAAGQKLAFEQTGGTGDWTWALFDPWGRQSVYQQGSFEVDLFFLDEGDYVLALLDGDNTTDPFTYQFQVNPVGSVPIIEG